MIDTHCHLSYPPLHGQLDQVLTRAADAGVKHMITIGTRLSDSLICREMARANVQISCAVGIHPHYAAEASADELRETCELFADPDVCACGEMGLDFHYQFAPRDMQVRVFETQLSAAIHAGKPLVLHCREAIRESLAILKNQPWQKGVFHCFTGTADEARLILDAGYFIGFTGVVTFKGTQSLRDLITFVPDDRLLIETDAPYLAPEPMRKQKINEPFLIPHVFACIASVRSVSLLQLIVQTSRNACSLFGLHTGC